MQRAARQHKDMEQRMEILDLLAKAIDNRTDRIHRAAQNHQHNTRCAQRMKQGLYHEQQRPASSQDIEREDLRAETTALIAEQPLVQPTVHIDIYYCTSCPDGCTRQHIGRIVYTFVHARYPDRTCP